MTTGEFEELNWSIYTSLADVFDLAHQEPLGNWLEELEATHDWFTGYYFMLENLPQSDFSEAREFALEVSFIREYMAELARAIPREERCDCGCMIYASQEALQARLELALSYCRSLPFAMKYSAGEGEGEGEGVTNLVST